VFDLCLGHDVLHSLHNFGAFKSAILKPQSDFIFYTHFQELRIGVLHYKSNLSSDLGD